MDFFDAIQIRKKKDIPMIKVDLEAVIRNYAGSLITESDKFDLQIFGDYKPNGLIIVNKLIFNKYYSKEHSFFRVWFSGLSQEPKEQFIRDLVKIRKKYQ